MALLTNEMIFISEEKIKRKIDFNKKIKNFFRQFGFLTFCIFVRHTSWVTLPILSICLKIKYIFLVNAGSDSDLDGYCPRWLAKSWYFSGNPTIGGIITDKSGKIGCGLVVVLPNTSQELRKQPKICRKIMRKLKRIKNLTFSKAIALSGQTPSIISRQKDFKLQKPFVKGVKGTVFCVMETINSVMVEKKLSAGNFSIAIVGIGSIGSKLMLALKSEGHEVFGVDIQKRANGKVYLRDDGKILLSSADMTVVLTPKGSDFREYIPWLRNNSIVIDDTHPRIRKRPNGVDFYKVAVGLEGVKFLPRLPGYKSNWIPGCAVEAMYAVYYGDFNGTPQTEFNQKLIKIGFFAHLIS